MEKYKLDFDILEEDKKIKIVDENGDEKEYEVIAYINTEDGDFIAYTDNKQLDNGLILIYVNSMVETEDGTIIFDEVDDDEVSDIVSKIRERL